MCMTVDVMENSLIRSNVDLYCCIRTLHEHYREWTYNRKQLRSITSIFVDTTVHAFVNLEVEVLTCVAFVLFTNDTGLTMLS